jgi:hypothetical protein
MAILTVCPFCNASEEETHDRDCPELIDAEMCEFCGHELKRIIDPVQDRCAICDNAVPFKGRQIDDEGSNLSE